MGVRNTGTLVFKPSIDTHVIFTNDLGRKMFLEVRVTTNLTNIVKTIPRRWFNHNGIHFGLHDIAAVLIDVACDSTASKWLHCITTPVQRVRHDTKRAYVDIECLRILCSIGTRLVYDHCIYRFRLRDNGGCNCCNRHRVGVEQ